MNPASLNFCREEVFNKGESNVESFLVRGIHTLPCESRRLTSLSCRRMQAFMERRRKGVVEVLRGDAAEVGSLALSLPPFRSSASRISVEQIREVTSLIHQYLRRGGGWGSTAWALAALAKSSYLLFGADFDR